MFYIRIADLNISIENQFSYVEKLCHKYRIQPVDKPDMAVRVSDAEIDDEIKLAEIPVSRAYAEGVCVYRHICRRLPQDFQAYLFHSAVIEYEGKGYAFAAKSGTGKSTHIMLWQKAFGDNVHIVNGDKPIMKFVDSKLQAYGTPWCGKEGYETNTSVPLNAICFLERGVDNQIKRISADEAVMRLFHQILTPSDLETVDALFPLLDRTLREVPCYLLRCNMDIEAAHVAYNGMKD